MNNQKMVFKLISDHTDRTDPRSIILKVPVVLIPLTGGIESAIILSQIIYWSNKNSSSEWFYKSYSDWYDETSLSEYQVRKIVNSLKKKGIIETKVKKANGNPTVHYKLKMKELCDFLVDELSSENRVLLSKEPISEEVIVPLETKESLTAKEVYTSKEVKTNSNNYNYYRNYNYNTVLLDFWNKKKIVVHRKLDKITQGAITSALKFHTPEQIEEAIANYAEIIHSDKYYFTYRWTLSEFLSRGTSYIGRQECKGYLMFMPEAKPFERFSKISFEQEKDVVSEIRDQFEPITSKWVKNNLLDKTRQTYFGFSTDKLKSYKDRLSDLKWWVFDYKKSLDFSRFHELELVIAGMLFDRKRGVNEEDLTFFLNLWKSEKHRFIETAKEILSNI